MIFFEVKTGRDVHPPVERIRAFKGMAKAKPFSDVEKETITLLSPSHTARDVAHLLGRDYKAVLRWYRRLGLKPPPKDRFIVNNGCRLYRNRRWNRAVEVFGRGEVSDRKPVYDSILIHLQASPDLSHTPQQSGHLHP